MKVWLSAIGIGVLVGTAAYAQLRDETIVVYGVGGSSCGEWLEAREAAKRSNLDVRELQFEMWLDGYLTGFNAWKAQNAIRGIYKTDVAGAKAFLDKTCTDNPTKAFVFAVNAFIRDQGGDPAKP